MTSSAVSRHSNDVRVPVQNFEKLNSYSFPSYQNAERSFLLSGIKNTLGRPPPTSNALFISSSPVVSLVRQHDESHTHGDVKSLPQFLSAYPYDVSGFTSYSVPLKTTVPLYSVFIPSACQYISNAFIFLKKRPAP